MSYSRSSVQELLSACAVLDQQLGFPNHPALSAVREAIDKVLRGDDPLTVAEARGLHARVVAHVREGRPETAKVAADILHRKALLAIDRLPIGCPEAIELASLALKTVEVL